REGSKDDTRNLTLEASRQIVTSKPAAPLRPMPFFRATPPTPDEGTNVPSSTYIDKNGKVQKVQRCPSGNSQESQCNEENMGRGNRVGVSRNDSGCRERRR